MAGRQIPFPYINGLDPRQQEELYRDFEAVLAQIPGANAFDAIIDPSLTGSSPETHEYINLTDLVLYEKWAAPKCFIVGVKQRGNPQIIETSGSTIDISTYGDLALFGLGSDIDGASQKGWDWVMLTCASTQLVYYSNLAFEPTSSGT